MVNNKAKVGQYDNLPGPGCGKYMIDISPAEGYYWLNGYEKPVVVLAPTIWSAGYRCGHWDQGHAYCLCIDCARRVGYLW